MIYASHFPIHSSADRNLLPSLAIMNAALYTRIPVLVLSTWELSIPSSRIPGTYSKYMFNTFRLTGFCVLILFSALFLTLLVLGDWFFGGVDSLGFLSLKMDIIHFHVRHSSCV